MVKNADSLHDDKGLSVRHLILVFLAGVAVCGVFFSLGFLVGYNERSARMAPVTERVATPATIPPTVNTPLETAPVRSSGAAPSTTSVPPPLAPIQASAPASPPGEQKPVTVPGTASPVTVPHPSPAMAEKKPEPGAAATPPAGAGEVGVGFTVQIAASRTKQDAEALVKILEGRGYPVFLITPEYAHSNDNLYRVQVGPFTSKDDAEKVRTKLTQEGFKPFIRH
ncbi:MAG: SPOR domain-containing protein [Terriglobia bacterium]|jgi:cell division septation protein DedD